MKIQRGLGRKMPIWSEQCKVDNFQKSKPSQKLVSKSSRKYVREHSTKAISSAQMVLAYLQNEGHEIGYMEPICLKNFQSQKWKTENQLWPSQCSLGRLISKI